MIDKSVAGRSRLLHLGLDSQIFSEVFDKERSGDLASNEPALNAPYRMYEFLLSQGHRRECYLARSASRSHRRNNFS